MIGRALLTAGLVFAVLVPTTWADSGHGHEGNRQQDGFALRLESGLASAGGADPNVQVSGPGITGTRGATVCSNRPGVWVTPLAGTKWVGVTADCTTPVQAGDYQYSVTFTLPALDSLHDLSLWGKIAADDSVTMWLNGTSVFTLSDFSVLRDFGTSDRSLFRAGANTLQFTVHNTADASGLDFVVNVTANGGTAQGAQVGDDEDDEGIHGRCVSDAAHAAAPGRGHGEAVREAAHSCPHGDEDDD